MKFTYRALYQGQVKSGKIDAFSRREVVEYLRNNGFFPIEIKDARDTENSFNLSFGQGVKSEDIINFTRQTAIMLNAGMTLSGCMDILIQQSSKQRQKELFVDIMNDIKSGENFSTALSHHPRHFNKLYLSLIKAGEASGKLNDIMLRLADDLDKQREFIAKLRGALTYPVIVMVGVVIVVFVLVTFIVPQLLGLYKELNIQLPVTTQFLIDLSDILQSSWPVILAGVIGGGYILKKQLATDRGQYIAYSLLRRIPFVGNLINMGNLVTSTRTLSLLLGSGVLVLESIGIVVEATSNVVYQAAFRSVYQDIQKGLTISTSLEKQGIFPPLLIQMTAVGERTGKLDEILQRVSEYFESESNIAIKALTTAIEPAIIIVLGGIVLFIVMAVLSPIYTLTNSLGAS